MSNYLGNQPSPISPNYDHEFTLDDVARNHGLKPYQRTLKPLQPERDYVHEKLKIIQ
jgi:hypothetical protein